MSSPLEDYTYMGDGTLVAQSTPGVITLTLKSATPTSDSSDYYTGLDRFGRVVDAS
jgi:hypothetical protein